MSDASLMAESYSEDHITQNTVMDEDNKPSCKFCGKKFAQSSYIKAHMRLHTGEKPFACSFCPKRFSDCSNWKKHERIHIRQMGGSLDKNSSSTNNNVKSSMLLLQSYQAPKPKSEIGNGYVCKICNKSFSNASSLTTHKRIHTGDRPYRCQTCGKSFTQIGTLRTHERIHTGEKPYVCKLCGQTFAQNGSYRMHERRHMMEMLHKCPICGIKFSQWEDAKAHIASHPEMAGCADFLKNHIPLTSGSQESLNDDETLPPIESFTSRPDQMALDQFPPPTFPFPHQLSPFLNVSAASLHFGTSLTADMPTPVSMFTSQVIKSEALNMQARSASQPNLYRHPVVTTSLPGQYTDQQTQDQNDTNIVSTTTARDRKYSSDSPTSRSMSTPEASLDNGGSRNETEKNSSETELNTMETGNKTASEDSSLTSDHSDNAASEEVHEIKSQNLHSRLISSSSRKQKHPMRRYSGSGSADPDTSTHPSQSLLNESDSIYSGDQSVEEFQDLSSVTGKLYRCEHCHIIFEDCTLYLLHNGFHSHDNDPFKCVICKSSCRDRIEFNCHLTSHIK